MGTIKVTAEPGTPQVIITREFDAPRELVYRAYTDPELVVQWLGPRRFTMELESWDVRNGGTWGYIHRDADGTPYGFHGVFHGEPSPDSLVQTFEFDGYPAHVSLNTATFEEVEGKTIVRTNSVFQSVEDRDGMVMSGMESGMNEGFERLDELLASMAVSV